MATYRSAHALMLAIENLLKRQFPDDLAGDPVNGKVQLLSSANMKDVKNSTSLLGLYLYRVFVDPNGRNRWLPAPPGSLGQARRELPLNLHFLLISWGANPQAEIDLHAWGMSILASWPEFDVAALAGSDAGWRDGDRAQVMPEELPNEDLFKIWDALPIKYSLSSGYVVRTARVELPAEPAHPPVLTRAFPQEILP